MLLVALVFIDVLKRTGLAIGDCVEGHGEAGDVISSYPFLCFFRQRE